MKRSNEQHCALYEAIACGAGSRVKAVAERHVMEGKARLLSTLNDNLERPKLCVVAPLTGPHGDRTCVPSADFPAPLCAKICRIAQVFVASETQAAAGAIRDVFVGATDGFAH